MGHGHHQVDVSHTVPTDLFLGNLHSTTVTDDAAVTDALVFATGTFVILYRTEYALAEQAITLGLVRSVVDGFRLQHLSTGFGQDGFRGSQAYGDLVEPFWCVVIFYSSHCNMVMMNLFLKKLLFQSDVEAQALELVHQNVERFR